MNRDSQALLLKGGEALGLNLQAYMPQFDELLKYLVNANAQFNLTALKSEEDIVVKHFVDSLTCLRGNHLEGKLTVLDLGTGAGFPSFPLAIVQADLHITPLDSTRKKINYVQATAQALQLFHVKPLVSRAETIGQQVQYRGQYDRVVARAVAALPVLIELALPLLKIGGRLIAQKGPIAEEELQAGHLAAQEVGGKIIEIDTFELPIVGDSRTQIIVEKNKSTSDQYPRREGVPQKQPLFWQNKETAKKSKSRK